MRPFVPNMFYASRPLDVDRVNENLQQMSKDMGQIQAQRYTYSTCVWRLDGVANTDPVGLRTLILVAPTGCAADVVGVELHLASATPGAVWSVDKLDPGDEPETSTFPTLSVASKGPGEVASGQMEVLSPLSSSIGDMRLRVSCPTADTLAGASLVLHLRADRFSQGNPPAALVPFSPTLLSAKDPFTAANMDARLLALETALNSSIGAPVGLHAEIVNIRAWPVANTANFYFPARASGTLVGALVGISSAAGETVTPVFNGVSATAVTATGTANVVTGLRSPATPAGSVANPAQDFLVQLIPSGTGVIDSAYIVLWWG